MALFCLVFTFVLSGCDHLRDFLPWGGSDDGYDPPVIPVTFTVSFNTAGGSAVAPVQVNEGDTAAMPTAPTRVGYAFIGWFTAAGGGVPFNFNTPITANTTLHARWLSMPQTLTVTFNTHNGSPVPPQTLFFGEEASEPPDPVRGNDNFLGWFTQATGGVLFDFDAPIHANTTIHAQWELAGND